MGEDLSDIAGRDLPPILDELRRLDRTWPTGVALAFHAPQSIYNFHPYLFAGAFGDVGPEALRDLSVAGALVASAVCVRDGLLDGRAGPDAPLAALRVQAMEYEAYRVWARYFPPGSGFWERYRALAVEYLAVSLRAARHAAGELPWSAFDEAFGIELARGTAALACSSVDALAELSGAYEHHERLRCSLQRYNVARQLWDDACDWKQDLLAGTPTLVIARVMASRPELCERPRDEALVREFARAVHYGGHIRHVIGLALEHLADAARLAAPLPTLPWHRVLEHLGRRCTALRADLDAIVERKLRSAAPGGAPPAP
jgi:hypothetical protein